MYHSTTTDKVKPILQDGLIPWFTQAVTNDPDQYQGEGVWLFAGLAQAKYFGSDNYCGDYVILEVDTEGLELIPDPEYDDGESWICLEHIPADRIVGKLACPEKGFI
jgi:hypothetical protein